MRAALKVMLAGAVLGLTGMIICVVGVAVMTQAFENIAAAGGSATPAELAAGTRVATNVFTVGAAAFFMGICIAVGGAVGYYLEKRQAKLQTLKSEPSAWPQPR